jgi:hypothetical protein
MVKRVKVRTKQNIPKALREQVWLTNVGKKFENKCQTKWCKNTMTVFDFQCGHDIPESKGGSTTIENLVAICSRCNQSMSNNFTFDEWNNLSKKEPKSIFGWFDKFAYKPKLKK